MMDPEDTPRDEAPQDEASEHTAAPADGVERVAAILREAMEGGDLPPPHDGTTGILGGQGPDFEDGGGYVEALSAPLAPTDAPVLVRCAAERQNDTGNARRFRHRHGDLAQGNQSVVHIQNVGWHVWDGARWLEDGDDRGVRPLAQTTAEMIGLESKLIVPTPEEEEAIAAAVSAEERLEDVEAKIAALDPDDKAEKLKLGQQALSLKRIIAAGEACEKRVARRRSDRLSHANASGNKAKLDGMLNEARPYVSRRVDQFDVDDMALNCLNGTLFFRVVEMPDEECPDPDAKRVVRRAMVGIRPHARGDWLTKQAPTLWCPEARCPVFLTFLAKVMPDAEIRAYLKRFFGYCLTGLTGEQSFCIFHGEGANGKSTLIDTLARILADYATAIPINSLMAANARKGQEATPDLARIPGARLVRASEPKEGLALDEAMVKELTGGEPVMIRRLNQEFIEVWPKFKLVISCNRKPRIVGNDDGIWRRIHLVPFDVQIPKEERDKHLKDKLWAERAGILAWMVEGLVEYLSLGKLDPPAAILEKTQEWRDDSDVMGAWCRAAIETTRDNLDKIETGPLYESFLIYARRIGVTPIAGTTFNRRLPKVAGDFGFTKGKSSVSLYEGIRFRDGFDPFHTPQGAWRGKGGYF